MDYLTMDEKDLPVNYGIFDLGPERPEARGHLKYILSDVSDIRRFYFRLGFHLDEFERCEYYKDFGYPTLLEFVEHNIGFDKSALSRCLNVYRRFHVRKESFKNGVKSIPASFEIAQQYVDYSYSQLCEMVSLSAEDISGITPDMTISQIRDYKKSLKAKVVMSQPEEPEPELPPSFDFAKYVSLHGAAKSAYVAHAVAESSFVLDLFDYQGNRVDGFNNVWVDALAVSGNYIVLRLFSEWSGDDV